MAVDKKSQHVGNHGGAYTDMNGMRRQFTYVDHDPKTKIGTSKMSPEELEELNNSIKDRTERTIDEVLALPAVSAVIDGRGTYEEFVERNLEKGIIWREQMVRDACRINSLLLHNLYLQVWRSTVKERYWFEEMPHEDILGGKWKEWI